MVEAERALIRAALADEGNEVLVLLSESCVPLWPAAQVYLQLMSERRSRVNACRNASNPDDSNQRMDYRWQPSMAGAGVTKQAWRKSSQWFSLSRRHAEVVAGDTAVNDVFARECWVSEWRFCVSGEKRCGPRHTCVANGLPWLLGGMGTCSGAHGGLE